MDWNAFSLALCRSSLFVGIVPLAGLRSQPAKVKAMLSLCLAIVLLPDSAQTLQSSGQDGLSPIVLAYLGQSIVLAALVMAIHELYGAVSSILSVQTGLSYSSVLDPTKESESTSLTSLIQLLFLLHFTHLDLHLALLQAGFASDFFSLSRSSADLLAQIAHVGKQLIRDGLLWGLPYMALLLSVDLVLGLGAKLYERFQSQALSNPLKQIVLLLLFLSTLPLWRGEIGPRIATLLSR